MSWSWWTLLLWPSSFSRRSVTSWDCGRVSREGTGMPLGFMQTSVNCINVGNFFHLRHSGVSNLSSRRSQFSLRSCAVPASSVGASHFAQGTSNGPELSVLQQIRWAHNALFSAACITRWSCGRLGTTKLAGKNLLILWQDANGKSVIPLERMQFHHLGFIACAWTTGEKSCLLWSHWKMGISHQDSLIQIL